MLYAGQCDDDSLGVQLGAEIVEHVRGREINFDVGLHVQDNPFHRRFRVVDRLEHVCPEVFRVGEAERGIVAIDDEPGVVTASG